MLWLALVFPEWPLQARFRTRDGTQALAVSQGQRVIALDAHALAQGVRVGQRLADALALAPDLIIRSRAPAAETAALKDAAGCALHFTPRVSLDHDALLLELSGSLKLFGGLDRL
ncbi:DNA polymerase Y family protein, partial [Herbaspirillum sp. HC18]